MCRYYPPLTEKFNYMARFVNNHDLVVAWSTDGSTRTRTNYVCSTVPTIAGQLTAKLLLRTVCLDGKNGRQRTHIWDKRTTWWAVLVLM